MTKSRTNSRLLQNTAIIIPSGTTGERPTGSNGYFRFNTTTASFEGYIGGGWKESLANTANLSFNGTTLTTANPINVPNTFGFKNRIINGDFRIDQRNVGASSSPTTGYTLDHWEVVGTQSSKFTLQRNAGSVTPPPGFTNYLGITSSSAYSITSTDLFRVSTPIEGLHMADFAWGTANAKTIAVSFWVRSSLTGTFGGAIQNAANTRAYPFTYTISSANTWEWKTIIIPGETSGAWNSDTSLGLRIQWGFGIGSTKVTTAGTWANGDYNGAPDAVSVVGTNGATWYITGVQLEVGTVSTSFDFREFGIEMNKCKRYFQKSYKQTEKPGTVQGDIRSGMCFHNSSSISGQAFGPTIMLPIIMRTDPTAVIYDHLGATAKVTGIAASTGQTAGVSYNDIGTSDTRLYIRCYDIPYYGFGFHYTLNAEL